LAIGVRPLRGEKEYRENDRDKDDSRPIWINGAHDPSTPPERNRGLFSCDGLATACEIHAGIVFLEDDALPTPSSERSLLNADPSLPMVQLDGPAAPATDRGNSHLCRKVCPPLHSDETKGPAHRLQQTKQRHR
jgi:hypothetical protein